MLQNPGVSCPSSWRCRRLSPPCLPSARLVQQLNLRWSYHLCHCRCSCCLIRKGSSKFLFKEKPHHFSANCWWWNLDCHTRSKIISTQNKSKKVINACKRQILCGKPLNGKKPRRPRGQKNNTRLIALFTHLDLSYNCSLLSVFEPPPRWIGGSIYI